MDRGIAEAIARGKPLLQAAPEYRQNFQTMLETILAGVQA
jgi:hypothetical protein